MKTDHILKAIEQARSEDLSDMVTAIIRRYRVLFPNEEVLFLSLPKHNEAERRQCLEAAFALLKKR